MKNVLVWNTFRGQIHGALCLDEANEHISKGNNVYLLDCDESIGGCYFNNTFDTIKCKSCILKDRLERKDKLSPAINIIHANQISKNLDLNKKSIIFNYTSFDELKRITYKNVNIGMGVVSSYIDYTRCSDPIINQELKEYFDKSLNQSVKITEILLAVIRKYKINHIIFCNGRLSQLKPALDLAKAHNINYTSVEIQGQTRKTIVKDYRENATQHDAEAFKFACEDKWNKSLLPIKNKNEIGSLFYYNRRSKKPAGDKVFTLKQKNSLMPSEWDSSIENIVIFNSSDDEFVALGGKYDTERVFTNQIVGIKEIVKHYEGDKRKHFYLRIHPNLTGIKEAYHMDLYKLKFNNLTIIPADSPIDTYSLMDNADKIIVFGSTTGIEGVYARKPVITLAYSLYHDFDIDYFPKSTEELWDLIDNSKLKPKYNDYVLKYGFYFMSEEGETTKYLNTQFHTIHILRKKIRVHKFQKIFGMYLLPLIINKIADLLSKAMRTYEFKKVPIGSHADIKDI